MKSTWIANYGNNSIRVENNWFTSEKLFVNDQLQDSRMNFFTADLSGYLFNENGSRENIKVNLSGWFSVACRLFVNDEIIEAQQIQ